MNCIIIEDDLIMSSILARYVNEITFLDLKESFVNAQEGLKYFLTEEIDLIFLDIELPDMNGFDFIKKILNKKTQVIVVSSGEKHALLGYKYDITDFLLKPVDKNLFLEAILKAKKKHEEQTLKEQINYNDTTFIKCGNSFHSIVFSDILYIEAMGDYISIKTDKEIYLVLDTMKDFARKIPKVAFMRIHNSFIVNTHKITKIEDALVTIEDKSIPISRKYRQLLFDFLKL